MEWTNQSGQGQIPITRFLSTHTIFPPICLLILASILFFSRLDAPLLEPEEVRYAEIPRQMLVHDSLTIPLLNSNPYYHKPPLMYWLVMASYAIFGVHDWAARIVPGCLGVLSVLLIYGWGQKVLEGTTKRGQVPFCHAAFLGGLVLCLSPRFLYLGRMISLDSLLSFCVLAGLLSAYRTFRLEKGKTQWGLVSALFCGLGVLTKGPVALVLIAGPLFTYFLWEKRRLPFRAVVGYLGVALLVPLPWFLAMYSHDAQAAQDFFWFHNVRRFVEPFDHAEPFWFYVPSLLLGMLPWSLLLVPLFRSLVFSSAFRSRVSSSGLGFFLWAFLWCFLFFSCSGCKRSIYLLPGLPSLAIALGCFLNQVISWKTVSWKRIVLRLPTNHRRWAWLSLGGLTWAGLTLYWVAVAVGLWKWPLALWLTLALLGLAAFLAWLGQGQSSRLWFGNAVLLFLILWSGVGFLLPDYNRRFSLRGQVQRFQEVYQQSDVVVAYPKMWDSLGFYLRANTVTPFSGEQFEDMLVFLEQQPTALIFIKRGPHDKQFRSRIPPHWELIPQPKQRQKVFVALVKKK